MSRIEALRQRLGEIKDIQTAVGLLHWDQEVCMPPRGADTRGRQLATLSAIAHRKFTSEVFGHALDELVAERDALSEDDRALVDVTRYDYARATCLPEEFVSEFALVRSEAYETWTRARTASDYAAFKPVLARVLDCLRRKADYLGYEDTPYDALLESHERGLTTRRVREMFSELATRQSALVERLQAAPAPPDASWVDGAWEESAQWEFTLRLLRDIGFDFDAGRQDRSVHPFTIDFATGDVRVTTRFSPDEPFSAFMGSLHEGGHALYGQGFDPADERTPLAEGISLGIHESQSRMWENMVGRSRAFWNHYTPLLAKTFPENMEGVTPEQVYRTLNRVQPSLIRVEADECTYNLHIVIRFEIEVALVEGTLSLDDLPGAWNAKVRDYLGIEVPDDARGCLQDIHWAHGSMGYFPTYALGNVYAAQLFERVLQDLPGLWDQVGRGEFTPLREWLRDHVHRVGRRKLPEELLQDVTGSGPTVEPYLNYLETKFGEVYGLTPAP